MVCEVVSPLHSKQKESKIIPQAIHLFLLEGHLPDLKLGMVLPPSGLYAEAQLLQRHQLVHSEIFL